MWSSKLKAQNLNIIISWKCKQSLSQDSSKIQRKIGKVLVNEAKILSYLFLNISTVDLFTLTEETRNGKFPLFFSLFFCSDTSS